MVKKYKKPSMSKIEEELYLNKSYTCPNGSVICETASGFYRVVRDGVSRTYDRMSDAWRSL